MLRAIVRRLLTLRTIKWLLATVTTAGFCFHYLPNRSSAIISVEHQSDTVTIDRQVFDYLALHLRERPYDGVASYTRFMTAKRRLKAIDGVEPLVAGMGLVVNDVLSFHYFLSIGACRQKPTEGTTGNDGSVSSERSLFVAVISAPKNWERRALIRRTWPSHLKHQTNVNHRLDVVGFAFVVGRSDDEPAEQQVRRESDEYGDILQVDVVDQYVDLSVKVASLFNWIYRYCRRVDYVLKVDDDVYVNVHNLATVLHSLTPSEPSIYGHPCGGNIPMRSAGKWATNFDNWPWQRFPIYFQGAGMVMTGSAIVPLLAAMQTTPYFIWDDMYLVGLCAVHAGVRLRTSNRIFVDMPANYADACFVRNTVMWTTRSVHVLNVSHHVSQLFYGTGNSGGCVDSGGNYSKAISNEEAADASEFPFGLVLIQ